MLAAPPRRRPGPITYLGRFFVMGAVVAWFLLAYALGRIKALAERDPAARRALVARLRGRILREAMSDLGATFIKLGQVLSTRPDLLPPEIVDELKRLQDRLPPFQLAEARAIVEADLGGKLEEHFPEFDAAPVAAASVAQVHRARLADGTEVAVKVLRPDVREKVARDAVILRFWARVIALHPRWRLSDPVGHLDEFCRGIHEQTDLRNEVEHYARFRQNFAGVPGVRFPRVHAERSSERVMTMEFLRGAKLDQLPPGDHRELALRIQNVIFKMCYEDGFVHADLHPGNLLLHESGDLAIFDVGLAKQVGAGILEQFLDFVRCIAMGTTRDFVAHIQRFHTYATGVDWAAFERDCDAFIREFRSRSVAQLELGGLINRLFALARTHRVRPLPDMTLVMVGIVTAEGLGKQLHPDRNLFDETARYLGALAMKAQQKAS